MCIRTDYTTDVYVWCHTIFIGYVYCTIGSIVPVHVVWADVDVTCNCRYSMYVYCTISVCCNTYCMYKTIHSTAVSVGLPSEATQHTLSHTYIHTCVLQVRLTRVRLKTL